MRETPKQIFKEEEQLQYLQGRLATLGLDTQGMINITKALYVKCLSEGAFAEAEMLKNILEMKFHTPDIEENRKLISEFISYVLSATRKVVESNSHETNTSMRRIQRYIWELLEDENFLKKDENFLKKSDH